jgi:2-C-methyl-D-erythritol 4-phosphate cytidylyltransferase
MLSAIILAAGRGSRLGLAVPKPLVKIGRRPAIIYSLSTLNKHPDIDEIVVVTSVGNQSQIVNTLKSYSFKKIKVFVLGGRRRQDSVYSGLKKIAPDSDWVLIHDSARPFINNKSITQVILAAKKTGAAILAVKPKATMKLSRRDNMVSETLDRDKLWEAQTPQVFKKELILAAYKKFSKNNVTDDATLVEKLGKQVEIVPGSYENIKITTVDDLLVANLIAKGFSHAI